MIPSLSGRRLPVLPLLGLAAGSICGCRSSIDERSDPLSLLWISLDTLRADHLGVYGYERETSPFLDSLARRGLYFEWVIAPQNSTLPSHMTMFTGLHPIVHGLYHGRRRPGLRLADSVRTLPEALAQGGYATFARVDGAWLQGKFGFSQGFDVYDDGESPLATKLDHALRDLEGIQPNQRFFYLIHTYEIHAPYEPPASYAARFTRAEKTSEADLALDLYDASIRYVDDLLRDFIEQLEVDGLLDSAAVVVTSDHGESFAEYGIPDIGHGGNNLHQNITRVPWIVHHPDAEIRGVVRGPVGLIDFPNTTLSLLGVEDRLPGGGRDVLDDGSSTGEYLSWTGAGAYSLYDQEQHLLWYPEDAGVERNALYDIRTDPLEQEPLVDEQERARLLQRLRSQLSELEAEERRLGDALRERFNVPEETLDRLRALGYID